jgi:hypothetical protein
MGQKGTPREDQIYSFADEYMDHGIYAVPNQKDWNAGHNRINELLSLDDNHIHPVTGKPGAPHLLVLEKCHNFIKEIEGYKWKKARNSISDHREEPMDGNDHHMDGLNGFLTSRPMDIKFSLPHEQSTDDWDFEYNMNGARVSHMAY